MHTQRLLACLLLNTRRGRLSALHLLEVEVDGLHIALPIVGVYRVGCGSNHGSREGTIMAAQELPIGSTFQGMLDALW